MWQELESVLKRIASLYRELLALAEKKKKIIIAVDVKDLSAIVKREEALISAIGRLEREREAVLTKILAGHNLHGKTLEFDELVKYCDGQTAQQLRSVREQIREILNKLAKHNESNQALIQKALEFVNFNLNIMSGASVGPTYGSQQASPAPQTVVARTIFDQKI